MAFLVIEEYVSPKGLENTRLRYATQEESLIDPDIPRA